MTEIYYIEDDETISVAVKEYLSQKGYHVSIFGTLEGGKKALERHIPSIVLIDWNMPDGRGDSLCQWIRRSFQDLPIIFLTFRNDSRDIVSGLQKGADDYVVKPFSLEVLYARIVALLRRTGSTAKPYLSCAGIMIDTGRRRVSSHGEEISLSAVEYQLLLYLMQYQGRTVTREQILAQVWDVHGNYVNDNTLTVTMKRLRDKLGQPACLQTVRSVGYRMEDTL